MKKFIILAAAAAAVAATPAVAQWAPGRWNPNTFWQGAPASPLERIHFLDERVNRAVADGSLSPWEARRVKRELNGIWSWIRRMHWEGRSLTPDQSARVQARLDRISSQIRWMRNNGR